MRDRTTLVWGIVFVVVGLAGIAVVMAILPGVGTPRGLSGFASEGQRIYYTGLDSAGRPIPRSVGGAAMGLGMMGGMACVDCHGDDGRGGTFAMMRRDIEVPDIRYSTLAQVHFEDGEKIPAWTDSQIKRAIREGIEPDGERLKAPMPRWDMTDAELSDVVAYLKELDTP